jgi:hypothetical protein
MVSKYGTNVRAPPQPQSTLFVFLDTVAVIYPKKMSYLHRTRRTSRVSFRSIYLCIGAGILGANVTCTLLAQLS